MEELRSEDLEELVQELQAESGTEEALSPEVEKLLRDLQPARGFMLRLRAARQLGEVSGSSRQIVRALMTVAETDASDVVKTMAATSLRAPVHQEILRQYPDLMQRARSATDQTAIQRERQGEEQGEKQKAIGAREKHNRKEPKVGGWIPVFIVFGIVWVVVSGIATTSNQWDFWCFPFVALPGVAVVALALWRWRAAGINREVLLRSMKETVGTVEALRKSVSDSDYGSTTTYYVSVRFEAEDAKMGTRVMVLKAQVAHRLWKGMKRGNTVGIRYAAEDPRIALIRGEW